MSLTRERIECEECNGLGYNFYDNVAMALKYDPSDDTIYAGVPVWDRMQTIKQPCVPCDGGGFFLSG